MHPVVLFVVEKGSHTSHMPSSCVLHTRLLYNGVSPSLSLGRWEGRGCTEGFLLPYTNARPKPTSTSIHPCRDSTYLPRSRKIPHPLGQVCKARFLHNEEETRKKMIYCPHASGRDASIAAFSGTLADLQQSVQQSGNGHQSMGCGIF